MISIVICVGSSCYVRGSDSLAETLERLIEQEGLQDQVELMGAFCMEHCSMGVSVRVGDRVYRGVKAQDAEAFFNNEIVPLIKERA